MKKLLVTSAFTETWFLKQSYDRYFLTEAFLKYDDKKTWEFLNKNVFKYHWDNRKKLQKDFNYLSLFYENSLQKIANELNLYHGSQSKIDYWRVIIGPWLTIYIHSLFDKWEMLRIAFEENKEYFTVIDTEPPVTPNNHKDFLESLNSDQWNFKITSRILASYYSSRINLIEGTQKNIIPKKIESKSSPTLKKIVRSTLEYFLKMISSKNKKVFIFLDKLPFSRLIKLNMSILQVPQIYFNEFSFNSKKRNNLSQFRERRIKSNTKNEFELFFYNNVLKDLPISYLENHNEIKSFLKKKKLNPYLIFTDLQHHVNDVFKIWLAEQKKTNKKVFTVYHGGSIPPLFNTIEKHEEDISDKNITFFKPLSKKQFQLPPYYIKKRNYYNKGKNCSIIGFENNRHAYKAASFPIANKTIDTFNFSIKFCKYLNNDVFDLVKIRPANIDSNWYTADRYKDIFNSSIISKKKSYESFYRNSRLIVCTYPQTTFSEAMASGIPTILIYDPNYNENHKEAQELVNKLKDAKIIFNDPIKAANHVNFYWNKIDEWWSNREVVIARNFFYKSALRVNSNWKKEWKGFIKNELNLINTKN